VKSPHASICVYKIYENAPRHRPTKNGVFLISSSKLENPLHLQNATKFAETDFFLLKSVCYFYIAIPIFIAWTLASSLKTRFCPECVSGGGGLSCGQGTALGHQEFHSEWVGWPEISMKKNFGGEREAVVRKATKGLGGTRLSVGWNSFYAKIGTGVSAGDTDGGDNKCGGLETSLFLSMAVSGSHLP
jgi:hypothetical protein